MTEQKKVKDLSTIREQIDKADQMLLTSFVTRMRLCADVAAYKKENGIAVLDAGREKEKLEEIRRLSPNDMEDYCVMLYNKIMEISRSYQKELISQED